MGQEKGKSPSWNQTLGVGRALTDFEQFLDQQKKKCPRCAEWVKFEAKVCRFCQNEFDPAEIERQIEKWRKQNSGGPDRPPDSTVTAIASNSEDQQPDSAAAVIKNNASRLPGIEKDRDESPQPVPKSLFPLIFWVLGIVVAGAAVVFLMSGKLSKPRPLSIEYGQPQVVINKPIVPDAKPAATAAPIPQKPYVPSTSPYFKEHYPESKFPDKGSEVTVGMAPQDVIDRLGSPYDRKIMAYSQRGRSWTETTWFYRDGHTVVFNDDDKIIKATKATIPVPETECR